MDFMESPRFLLMDLNLVRGAIADVDCGEFGVRAINNLNDVQIVLNELLSKRDRDLAKAKDQRGHQIKNAGDAKDPQDLVTLSQMQEIARKIAQDTVETIIGGKPKTPGTTPPPTTTPPPIIIPPPGPGGPPGPAMPGIPMTEDLSGYIGGAGTTSFTLTHFPIASTVQVQLNGTFQHEPDEILISGAEIIFVTGPRLGDTLVVNYYYLP
jgi:hypothetical protein